MKRPDPLVVIVGPTASGKSALAMEVAQKLGGEIICADSRTVYKGMDIGTAKPTAQDQKRVPHHLLDVVEPNQHFTAADFKHLANTAIHDISSRGKLSIMVGGTGLYVDSVIFDYKFGRPADPAYRRELAKLSVEELQEICSKKDIPLPINKQNKRHLIRAIELGGLVSAHGKQLRKHTIVVGITTEKEILRARIAKRAAEMVEQGILDEVKALGEKYGWQSEAMTGNIYPVFKQVLDGDQGLEEAIEEFIKSDMRLAKRQRTWFKRNPFIIWSDDPKELATKIDQFVANLNT